MAVSLLLTAFLFGLPALQYQTYNQDGVMKGLKGIAYTKSQHQDISVPITDEYVEKTITEYQKLFENPDNVGYDGSEKFLIGDAYWNFVAPREKQLSIIASAYDSPGENSGFNKLPELDMANGAKFYQTRDEKVESLLNTPSRDLSTEQKEYWSNLSSKVKTPLQYGYHEGWEIIMSSFELLMFALLAVCIVTAPVFSGEYQAGTDAVILSGKYGKTRLVTAKIISSILFGVLAFTLHVIVAFGLPLTAFGADGWNLPLQAAGLTIPYLVLVVLVPVLFIPLFLSPGGTTGAYNLTLFLLPYRCVMPEIGKYISYQIGGLVLDALSMRAILYAILTAVMLPLARLGFKKHQVA